MACYRKNSACQHSALQIQPKVERLQDVFEDATTHEEALNILRSRIEKVVIHQRKRDLDVRKLQIVARRPGHTSGAAYFYATPSQDRGVRCVLLMSGAICR